jgi:hypothetical protein
VQDLLPLVYAELHRLAEADMRRERPDQTLRAAAGEERLGSGENLVV